MAASVLLNVVLLTITLVLSRLLAKKKGTNPTSSEEAVETQQNQAYLKSLRPPVRVRDYHGSTANPAGVRDYQGSTANPAGVRDYNGTTITPLSVRDYHGTTATSSVPQMLESENEYDYVK